MNRKLYIPIVLIIIALFLFVGALFIKERTNEEKIYNNGYCVKCAGQLEQVDCWFDRTSGHDFHTFKCSKCGEEWVLRFYGESY